MYHSVYQRTYKSWFLVFTSVVDPEPNENWTRTVFRIQIINYCVKQIFL